MSEGQPALTPDQENELRLYAMGGPAVPSAAAVRGLLAELAREREAREQDAERHEADVEAAETAWNHLTAKLEGRVRDLQEERAELVKLIRAAIGSRTSTLTVQEEILVEALVGLPEGTA